MLNARPAHHARAAIQRRMNATLALYGAAGSASVPIAKFAIPCGGPYANFGIEKDTSNSI
jgi:hypothetical protein